MKTENYNEERTRIERREMFFKLNMIPWLLLVITLAGGLYYSIQLNFKKDISKVKDPIDIVNPADETQGFHIKATKREVTNEVTEVGAETEVVTIVVNELKREKEELKQKVFDLEIEKAKLKTELEGLQGKVIERGYGRWEKKGEEMGLEILDIKNRHQLVEMDWWKIIDAIKDLEKVKEEYRWLFAMNTVTNSAGVARFRYTPENHEFARSIGYDLEGDIIDNIKGICDNEGVKLSVIVSLTESIKRSFKGFQIMNSLKGGK